MFEVKLAWFPSSLTLKEREYSTIWGPGIKNKCVRLFLPCEIWGKILTVRTSQITFSHAHETVVGIVVQKTVFKLSFAIVAVNVSSDFTASSRPSELQLTPSGHSQHDRAKSCQIVITITIYNILAGQWVSQALLSIFFFPHGNTGSLIANILRLIWIATSFCIYTRDSGILWSICKALGFDWEEESVQKPILSEITLSGIVESSSMVVHLIPLYIVLNTEICDSHSFSGPILSFVAQVNCCFVNERNGS